MTRRIAIIGSGRMSAALALALLATEMALAKSEPDAKESLPSIKGRDIRGPELNQPQNAWSGERRRAQWKDEQQRRGRQR